MAKARDADTKSLSLLGGLQRFGHVALISRIRHGNGYIFCGGQLGRGKLLNRVDKCNSMKTGGQKVERGHLSDVRRTSRPKQVEFLAARDGRRDGIKF